MEAFRTHTGIGVPLRRSNVDTDQIIPAEWLKRVERTGFGKGLFATWRDDRDFVLHHMGQPVWIRVHADFPAITIMARVGHGVYSRRATEVELGILNRTATFSRWSLAGRDVWQETAMVALPFVPLHLSVLIDRFLQTMTSTRDDLAYRTGAKVA